MSDNTTCHELFDIWLKTPDNERLNIWSTAFIENSKNTRRKSWILTLYSYFNLYVCTYNIYPYLKITKN